MEFHTNDVQVDSDIDTVVITDPPTCDIVNQALLAAWVKMAYGSNAPVDVSYSLTPTRYYGLVADQGKEDSVSMQGCALPVTKKTDDQQLDYEHFASGPAGADAARTWDHDGSSADWYGGHEIAPTCGYPPSPTTPSGRRWLRRRRLYPWLNQEKCRRLCLSTRWMGSLRMMLGQVRPRISHMRSCWSSGRPFHSIVRGVDPAPPEHGNS